MPWPVLQSQTAGSPRQSDRIAYYSPDAEEESVPVSIFVRPPASRRAASGLRPNVAALPASRRIDATDRWSVSTFHFGYDVRKSQKLSTELSMLFSLKRVSDSIVAMYSLSAAIFNLTQYFTMTLHWDCNHRAFRREC
jgi:hypothetical protein